MPTLVVASCSDSGTLLLSHCLAIHGVRVLLQTGPERLGPLPGPAQQEAGRPGRPSSRSSARYSISSLPSLFPPAAVLGFLGERGEATARGSRWHPIHSGWGVGEELWSAGALQF